MNQINFITVGSKDYFNMIRYSSMLLSKIYPESHLFIYDWGLKPFQINEIKRQTNIILIDWTDKLSKAEEESIQFERNMFGDTESSKKFEYLFCQKPLCILDCAKRIDKNLVYLDADAFLIDRIDEIFSLDFDIGVTTRTHRTIFEYSRKTGILMFINAGVIFFKLDTEGIQLFVNEWISEINKTKSIWLEQTALNNLVSRTNKKIFNNYYTEGILHLSKRDIKIKTFPCSIYNHYEIKEGFNPKSTKILHFRGSQWGLSSKERIREIILEFRLGPFYYYLLKSFPKTLRKFVKESLSIFLIIQFIKNPLNIRNWLREIEKSIKKLKIKLKQKA